MIYAPSATLRWQLVSPSHVLPGPLGGSACEHAEGHDFLVAVEVKHAAGGPELGPALEHVLGRLYLHLAGSGEVQRVTSRTAGSVARDPWHDSAWWLAPLVHRYVEDRIPEPLRGPVSAWTVRLVPDDAEADGYATGDVVAYPRSSAESPAFPGDERAFGEAVDLLRRRAEYRAGDRERSAGRATRRTALFDQWRPAGAGTAWKQALDLAESALDPFADRLWFGQTYTEMPEATIAALAVALYLDSVDRGIGAADVRIDQIPPVSHHHDLSDWEARLRAAGHDLEDPADPVSACWEFLRYDYREPDPAVEHPAVIQQWDEDSSMLCGTRFYLGLGAALAPRATKGLWPGGTVTALEPSAAGGTA